MGTMSSLSQGAFIAAEGNYQHNRSGKKICKITPHIMAGILTGQQCAVNIFQKPGRKASANYCIGNAGDIVCNVYEEDRAYTSSSKSNDEQAITIEVSNNTIGGDWTISNEAWNSLVNLCVDICKRYGFRLEFTGNSNGSLTYHSMFANTTCPGNYLKSKMQELANTVNSALDGQNIVPEIKPIATTGRNVGDVVEINGIYTASNSTNKLKPAKTTGTITKIINGAINPYLLDNGNLGWTNDSCIVNSTTTQSTKSIVDLANEVIAGKYGSGEARKQALGSLYNEVQAKVNEILTGKSTISTKKSNEQIADEVIAGKWGNGIDRQIKLKNAGYDYKAIQKIVNSKM